jgi:hypothetical protein
MRVLRIVSVSVGGMVAITIAGMALLAAVVGLTLLVIWLREPSPSENARRQVQALFVNRALERTATVRSCRESARTDLKGERIWICRVEGNGCGRSLAFVVDPQYGTEPYNNDAADATDRLCAG